MQNEWTQAAFTPSWFHGALVGKHPNYGCLHVGCWDLRDSRRLYSEVGVLDLQLGRSWATPRWGFLNYTSTLLYQDEV